MNVYFITLTFSLMKLLRDMSRAVSSNLVDMVIISDFQGWFYDLLIFGKMRK